MIAFLAPMLVASFCAAGSVIFADSVGYATLWPAARLWIIFLLFAWPAIGALMAASIIDWCTPRQLFAPRSGMLQKRMLRGTIAAGLVVVLGSLSVVFADRFVRDEYLLFASGFLGATVVVLLGKRLRSGCCWTCGYDLRGSMSVDRCPECGEAIHAYSLTPPQTPPRSPAAALPRTPCR